MPNQVQRVGGREPWNLGVDHMGWHRGPVARDAPLTSHIDPWPMASIEVIQWILGPFPQHLFHVLQQREPSSSFVVFLMKALMELQRYCLELLLVPLSSPHRSLEYGNYPRVLSFCEDLWSSCLRSAGLKTPWKTPRRMRRTQELVEQEPRKTTASAHQLSNSKTFYQTLKFKLD